MRTAAEASPDHPVLDRPLPRGRDRGRRRRGGDATGDVFIGAVMEHIEEAGRALGRLVAARSRPRRLSDDELDEIEDITRRLARRLGVVGLLNLQLAVKDERIWVIEANPRASRTVPFVSKVIGRLARADRHARAHRPEPRRPGGRGGAARRPPPLPAPAVHEREGGGAARSDGSPASTPCSGPEMKSTGEVMGIDADSGMALAKAMVAAGPAPAHARARCSSAWRTATSGRSCSRRKRLADLGFRLVATGGTAGVLQRAGIAVERVAKVSEGPDNVAELIRGGRVDLVDQHAVRSRAAHRRVLHPDGGRDRPACRASPRSRACSRRCGASRRCSGARPSRDRSRSTMPRRWRSRRRRGSRSNRRRRPRRGRAPREAGPRRDPVHAQARRVPLDDARGARDRGAGAARAVPGGQMPEGREFLLRRHFAIHQASRRGGWAGTLEFVVDPSGPGHRVAGQGASARVPGRDRPARQGVRVPEAAHELSAGGGGARRGVALLPGAGAARQAQAGRHDRRWRDAGAGLQADRGQAPVADHPDRHGRRHAWASAAR